MNIGCTEAATEIGEDLRIEGVALEGKNTYASFSHQFCLVASVNTIQSTIADMTITRPANCEHTLSLNPNLAALLPFNFPYEEGVEFKDLTSLDLIIQNSNSAECERTCSLLDQVNCQMPYEGGNIRLNGDMVETRRNVAESWYQVVCVSCETPSDGSLESVLVDFFQLADCPNALTPSSTTVHKVEYDSNQKTEVQGLPLFFNQIYNQNQGCEFTKAELRAGDCVSEFNGHAVLTNVGPEFKKNIRAGYVEDVCLYLEIGELIFQKAITVEQMPDPVYQGEVCPASLSVVDPEVDAIAKAYQSVDEKQPIAKWSTFFSTTLSYTCPITDCTIRTYSDCSESSQTDLEVGAEPDFEILTLLNSPNIVESYFCVECGHNWQTIKQKVAFTQVAPCIDLEAKSSTRTFQLAFGGSTFLANAADLFEINDCSIQECELLDSDCQTIFDAGEISLNKEDLTGPFELTAETDQEAGYSVQACLKCSNGVSSLAEQTEAIEISVIQSSYCSQEIMPDPSQSKEFEYDGTLDLLPVADITEVLYNPNSCRITSCSVMDSTCTVKANENLSIDEKDEVTLLAKQNVEAGYTVEVCVQCTNGYVTGQVMYTVTQLAQEQSLAVTTKAEQSTTVSDQASTSSSSLENLEQIVADFPKSRAAQIHPDDPDLIFEISFQDAIQSIQDLEWLTITSDLGELRASFTSGQRTYSDDYIEVDMSSGTMTVEFDSLDEMGYYLGRNTINIELTDRFQNEVDLNFQLILEVSDTPVEEEKDGQHGDEEEDAKDAEDAEGDNGTVEEDCNGYCSYEDHDELSGSESEQQMETDSESDSDGGLYLAEDILAYKTSKAEEELQQLQQLLQNGESNNNQTEEEALLLDQEIEELDAQIEKAQNMASQLTDAEKELLAAKIEVRRVMVLQSSGFVETEGLGIMFPGVDVEDVKKSKVPKDEIKKIQEPRVVVKPMTAFGEIKCQFNQPMIAPKEINQRTYKHAFNLYIISKQTGNKIKGRFKDRPRSMRNLQEEYENENLRFDLSVTKHTEKDIVIQVEFESIDDVGQHSRDINFEINDPSMFKSKLTHSNLILAEGQKTTVKPIPQLIKDKVIGQLMVNSTGNAGSIFDFTTSSNFFINFLLKGSMQQLWGLIRALQVIVYSDLVIIKQPAVLGIFFEGCVAFASTDIFDGNELLYNQWRFRETAPLNDQFDRFDYGTMIFINNSGSYFLIQAFLLYYFPIRWLFNKIAACNGRVKWARQAGVFFQQKDILKPLLYSSQKLLLETFFDLSLAIMITLAAFTEDYNLAWNPNQNKYDRADTIVLAITAFLMALMVLYGYLSVRWQYDDIKHGKISFGLEFYMEGVRTKTRLSAQYTTFFLLRRIIMTVVLVYLRMTPYTQMMLLLVLSLTNLQYLMAVKPMQTKYENQMEIFDELIIFTFLEIRFFLLDDAVNSNMRTILGWTIIGFVSFNILTHFGILMFDTATKLLNNYKRDKNRKLRRLNLKKQLEENEKTAQTDPTKYKGMLETIKFNEAIEYARNWWPERTWLLDQGVDISTYPEEMKFQLYCEDTLFKRKEEYEELKGLELAVEKTHSINMKSNTRAKLRQIAKQIAKPMDTISEECENQTSQVDYEKRQSNVLDNILENRIDIDFEGRMGFFHPHFDQSSESDSEHNARDCIGSIFAQEFSMDFMADQDEIEKKAKAFMAKSTVKDKKLAFYNLAKYASMEDTDHEALLQCMVELNSLARWAYEQEKNTASNDMSTFICNFYRQLLKKGHGNKVAEIDCSGLDDALEEVQKEVTFNDSNPLEVLRVIIDQLKLVRTMDLFSIDLNGQASCQYFHTIQIEENLQSGLIVTDLSDIAGNIRNYMNDLQYTKMKKACRECGFFQKRLQWKIKRFPQILILRVILQDHTKDINLELDLDFDDYDFYRHSAKQKKQYTLRGIMVETKKRGAEESEYHSIVSKRVQNSDSDTQWVIYKNGEQTPAGDDIEWENTLEQVQYPCLLFYEFCSTPR